MKSSLTIDHYSAGEVQVEQYGISAGRTHGASMLTISLTWNLEGPDRGEAWDFGPIQCRLSTNRGWISRSGQEELSCFLSEHSRQRRHTFHVFEISDRVLSLLERERLGGAQQFYLDVNLQVTRMLPVKAEAGSCTARGWAYVDRLPVQLHRIPVSIAKEEWLRLLEQMGYGRTHIIELPLIASSASPRFADALADLDKAQEFERSGHYPEAAVRCRKALEHFCETFDKEHDGKTRQAKRLKSSWQTRLGDSTYTWLNDSIHAIKGETNRAAHSGGMPWTQARVQMLLVATTAVISYAVECLSEGDSSV